MNLPAQRIDADLLIPGSGAPMTDTSVLHRGGRIEFVGPRAELDADGRALAPLHVRTLLPGWWDCHTHFAGIRGRINTEELMLTPETLAVARSVKDAETALRAGFTSVRDVGGYGCVLAQAVAEGTVHGPSIYSANKVLSQTGGHSDAHRLPYTWVTDPCRSGGMLHLADGVDECVRAVRLQLRAGAEVIKVCASGGVFSAVDNPVHQQYLDRELRAIVEEAARAERVVAAHCHGRAGILAAARAGCRTIEHGTYVDAECADVMAEAGAILVPTRTIFESMLLKRDALPPVWRDEFQAFADRHLESMALAHERDVTIALGTDIGVSEPNNSLSWGKNATEFGCLVEAGMSTLTAIEAGTAHGPLTLGARGPRSGMLAAGYDADFVAVDGDPLDELAVLTDPDRITHVVRGGELAHVRTAEN